MAFAKEMNASDRYVVWDGVKEKLYIENGHDCIVDADFEFTSVQEIRQLALKSNVVPTVVFACKRGQESAEARFNGRMRGVFTYYWADIINNKPTVTLRDAICLVNAAMQNSGFEQQAEVICRIDILDMPSFLEISLPNSAYLFMYFDMCRNRSEFFTASKP